MFCRELRRQRLQVLSPDFYHNDSDIEGQEELGIEGATRAGRSRDTTGYNPRPKIIEGASWTRVELYSEHGRTVLLAA